MALDFQLTESIVQSVNLFAASIYICSGLIKLEWFIKRVSPRSSTLYHYNN